jgi:cbb3-type cytochrome oxidase cytochrome c subunit
MKLRIVFCCCLAALGGAAVRAAEDPRPGVAIGRGSGDGHVLLGELGCVACHEAGPAGARLLVRQAPRLGEVGDRITPEYLRAFLARPHEVKAGTPMPDLLHDLGAEKRAAAVEDLVHFLGSLGGPLERIRNVPPAAQLARGRALYHSVGCVACHPAFEQPPRHKVDPNAPAEEDDRKAPAAKTHAPIPLGNLALKTNPDALARFLVNPLHIRPSGRMPGLDLTSNEAFAIADYLLSGPAGKPPARAAESGGFKIDPVRKVRGRDLFASRGCASCHDTSAGKEPESLDLMIPGTTVTGIAPSNNSSPGSEGPRQAIDNNPKTKYLNFGKAGSGLHITLPGAPVVVTSLQLTSANDSPGRDPASYLLEGSTDGKTFQKIDGRIVPPFPGRARRQSFQFDNAEAYSVYKLTFPTLQGGVSADAMQIADIRLFAAPQPEPGVASTLKALPLLRLKPDAPGGCLDTRPAPGRPRFELSPAQRTALRSALAEVQKGGPALTPAQRIDRTMTALNCYACHARGGKGGPEAGDAAYFTYEVVVDLGDEGRLPPALNEVGAKLTPEGFEEALSGGPRYRTWMATRMPRFGRANVGQLLELFRSADAGKVPVHKPALVPSMVADGRRLVGKNALTCVSCHAWAGVRLPGAEGLDLVRATRRLRPEWFHALLLEPQRLRPRTRMPSSWPEGKSFFPRLQGGDVHKQIDSIWAYLSQGERGGPPDGIRVGKTDLLVPGEEPIVFRTFLDGVSAHAILVGFRQRTHVVFDANRVRMVQAWTGDFISPASAWEGRGGGYAKVPGSDIVRFPEGPPLAVLESQSAPWPADLPKVRLGTNRTPPGWRYSGYRLDEQGVPIFLYRAGPVAVEETPNSDYRDRSGCLIRRFRLTAEEKVENLYLRVATGKKIAEKDGVYLIDDKLSYRLEGSPLSRPIVREAGGQQELLVPVRFAPAVCGKGQEASIRLELTW